MSKPFHFKQFAVAQDGCAMKVGTDGVLLGAWTKAPQEVCQILDIGTGTGVIALMLAQRFANAEVLGIDIEKGAFEQAQVNFNSSKFAQQLSIKNISIQNFTSEHKFDIIVSNPPFFSQGVIPQDKQRLLARHTVSFSFEVFFEKMATLLAPNGILSIIIPKIDAEMLVEMAKKYGLFCEEYCTVYPNPEKDAKRVLLAFSLHKKEKTKQTSLTIETNERHQYTAEYQRLLKEFYLAF